MSAEQEDISNGGPEEQASVQNGGGSGGMATLTHDRFFYFSLVKTKKVKGTSGHDYEMLASKNKNNFPNLQVTMFDNVHFMKPELMLVKLGTKTNGKKITCEKDTSTYKW